MKISLFIPCLVDQAALKTGVATRRVLERPGYDVRYDRRQTCCGQALFNMGFRDEARRLAMRFVRLFHNTEAIVAPGGSCVAMVVNHYGELDLPAGYAREWEQLRRRVWELTVFLSDVLNVQEFGTSFRHPVSVHSSCHSLRELGIDEQPVRLLKTVQGLELVDGEWGNECCGFGGAFSMKYRELAHEIADRRALDLARGGAEFITGTDDSCLHHLEQAFRRLGLPQRTIHIARILGGEANRGSNWRVNENEWA